jgi:fucose 4-O-acetylase-like acetyltransferase
MNQRIAWADYAKGMGIILVVYGHSARGLMSSGMIPSVSIFSVVDYTIYTFHMPLFFFLSVMFV